MLKRFPYITALLLLTIDSIPVNAEELVVIVNNQNKSESLSGELIGDIYLGRTNRFPTGEPAKPVDLPKDLPITADFYSKVVKKTPAQLRAHWSRLVFTGKGRPPKRLADENEVKSTVAKNNHSIGYVYEKNADDDVKVVLDVQ